MRFAYGLLPLLMGTGVVAIQPSALAVPMTPTEIARLAKEFTVFIQGVKNPDAFGSGVIISRNGNRYTVLTAQHVVAGMDQYTVTTPDSIQYGIKDVRRIPGADLAVVQFESSSAYSIARLGDSDKLQQLQQTFVAGFPKPGQNIQVPVFVSTIGTVNAVLEHGAKDGYALAYDNITRPGMSGGPVLNAEGEIIAIHGRKEGDITGQPISGAWLNLGIPINPYKAAFAGDTGLIASSDPSSQVQQLQARAAANRQAQLQTQQEAQIKADLERQAQSKVQQDAQVKAQREAQLKAEADRQAKAKAQQAAQVKVQQTASLPPQQEAQIKAELERQAQLKLQQTAQLQAQQNAQPKAELDPQAQIKAELERQAQLKLQQTAQLQAQQDAQVKTQRDAQLQAQQDAQLKADLERQVQLKAQQAVQLKAQAAQSNAQLDPQAQIKAELERQAQLKIQQTAQLQAQQAAQLQAQRDEQLKAQQEAQLKADLERQVQLKAQQAVQLKAQAAQPQAELDPQAQIKADLERQVQLRAQLEAQVKALENRQTQLPASQAQPRTSSSGVLVVGMRPFEVSVAPGSSGRSNAPLNEGSLSPEMLLNRANDRAKAGNSKEAIQDLTSAIGINANFGQAYFNRGYYYYQAGETDKALADFLKAAELFKAQKMEQELLQVETILAKLK